MIEHQNGKGILLYIEHNSQNTLWGDGICHWGVVTYCMPVHKLTGSSPITLKHRNHLEASSLFCVPISVQELLWSQKQLEISVVGHLSLCSHRPPFSRSEDGPLKCRWTVWITSVSNGPCHIIGNRTQEYGWNATLWKSTQHNMKSYIICFPGRSGWEGTWTPGRPSVIVLSPLAKHLFSAIRCGD